MTNALAYTGSFNGFSFGNGARPGASVRSLTGFGSHVGTAPVTESSLGAGFVGTVSKGSKQIRLGLNLHADTPAALDTLRDEILHRFDPSSVELPLTINGRTMFVHVLEVDPGRDPSWAGPERSAECEIVFQAGDSGLYSDETDLSFGGGGSPVTYADLTFTNLGNSSTRHWHAWRLRITAHGTVTSPYISLASTGQIVTWLGLTMTGGQVLTVGDYRVSRVGSRRVDGYRRSAGNSEFPDHPVLPPGVSTVRVGAASGSVSGNLFARSVYA